MRIELFVVTGSHPCAAVEAALRLKGLAYERVVLPPFLHKVVQRVMFGSSTVPNIRIDGNKVTGSLLIMRTLDALAPEPSLYPLDSELRNQVETAETWGEATLQPLARRLAWTALTRNPEALRKYAANAHLLVPLNLAMNAAKLVTRVERRIQKPNPARANSRLAQLTLLLDQVDQWISDGVLNGEQPNAADLQIGASLALLHCFASLAPMIAERPCAQLVKRYFADFTITN